MKKTFTIFFCTVAFSVSVYAQTESYGEYANARLFEGQKRTGGIEMGLDIDLKDQWYTYWRMPGDSGLAPSFDWSESENVKDIRISWPVPERFVTQDMNSFGYDDAVLFPLLVTPVNPDAKTEVRIKLDLVVCHEICVPQTLNVSRVLDGNVNKADIVLLRKAQKSVPESGNTKELSMGTAVLGKDSIVVAATSKSGFAGNTDVIIETQHAVLTRSPEIIPDEKDKTRAVLKVKAPDGFDLANELFGKKTTITLINGSSAIEKEFTF